MTNTKPRSFVLPLSLILLTCLAFGFITSSLQDRIDELQAQVDSNGAQTAFLEVCAAQAIGQLNQNDIYLKQGLDETIKEVKRLSLNQETLIIQQLGLDEETVEENK